MKVTQGMLVVEKDFFENLYQPLLYTQVDVIHAIS